MIDGGDCSMVNGCESGWAAAWGSLGAISIYITCFKKAVQACRHRAERSDGTGRTDSSRPRCSVSGVFFCSSRGFLFMTTRLWWQNVAAWMTHWNRPAEPPSEDANLCPDIVFRLSSLTTTKALIRLDCLRLIGSDVLLAGFHWGFFFLFLMRYGGCCGLSKKHLSTERDINLVHKLHLRKKRKGKERLKRWRKFLKQLSWACFSPIVITIIMMIIINLPGLVDFVKKAILKPQPKFRVCCVSVAQRSTTRPRRKNVSELLLREERGDCASAKMLDEKPQLWLTDGSSR